MSLASDLGRSIPVVAAPMAGGPTTVDLVTAAGRAGGFGFLAAGYRTAEEMAAQVAAARAAAEVFGVNLFVPHDAAADRDAYARYRDAVRPVAEAYGLTVPEEPVETDDAWRDKVDVLLADPVPVVSFTFAVPDRPAVDALRAAGSLLVQTVTTPVEAVQAASVGVDALVVQASAAGAHSGTFTPATTPAVVPLVALVAATRAAADLPVIAAGGLGTPADVAAVMRAGADLAMVGTALLLCPEAGTTPTHRAALRDPNPRETVVTRSFTGRPARALRNGFIDTFDAIAPTGYPALHHLTSGLRRAAAAAGDADNVNLWAGTSYRSARVQPAAEILQDLARHL